MHHFSTSAATAMGRMSGPPQRGVRSAGMRGSAAQASRPHPLEYLL